MHDSLRFIVGNTLGTWFLLNLVTIQVKHIYYEHKY